MVDIKLYDFGVTINTIWDNTWREVGTAPEIDLHVRTYWQYLMDREIINWGPDLFEQVRDRND